MTIRTFFNSRAGILINILIIFILFIGLIILRVQNLSLKHDITRRQQEKIKRKQTIHLLNEALNHNKLETSLEGMQFPFEKLKPISRKEPAREITPKTEYSVFILFAHFDCATCLDWELRIWQSFNITFPKEDKVEIIGIANTEAPEGIYRQTRAIVSFPVFHDKVGEFSIFSQLNIQKGPVVLFVNNRKKQIIHAHFVEIDNKEKSEMFLEKVKRFVL
jgi:hypothetical protein